MYTSIWTATSLPFCSNLMADTKYNKPYCGIQLNLTQVGVDIRLNDIPIYYDDQHEKLNVDLPTPHSIVDGNNEFKIIVSPPKLNLWRNLTIQDLLTRKHYTALLLYNSSTVNYEI